MGGANFKGCSRAANERAKARRLLHGGRQSHCRHIVRTSPELLHPCDADRRFSFGLLLPGGAKPRQLLVVVHDSTRQTAPCLSAFAAFADQHHSAVLAPLFPADLLGDGNEDGYKFLIEGDIRYDRLLEVMVEQVAAATGCPADRFCCTAIQVAASSRTATGYCTRGACRRW
jgi:hypothetical protein